MHGESPVPLFLFVCPTDRDVLPAFLRHYRRLGVSSFQVAVHEDRDGQLDAFFSSEADCTVRTAVRGPFTEQSKIDELNRMVSQTDFRWGLCVDADEFIEMPFGSLSRTVDALEQMGLAALSGWLVQRADRQGGLPGMTPGDDPHRLFPMYDFNLCERMGLDRPCWKLKFPLFRKTTGLTLQRGNHLPPSPGAGVNEPIRCVINHFKWRGALLQALRLHRGEDTNAQEMARYDAWISAHDMKVPDQALRPYSVEDMKERGLLVEPTPGQVEIAGLMNELPRADTIARPEKEARLRALLGSIDGPAGYASHRKKICFVSFELVGPMHTGGIGTAISALAENLAAIGNDVDVVYCPHHPRTTMTDLWFSYWKTRGVTVRQLPRYGDPGETWLRPEVFRSRLVSLLESQNYSVVHFDDAGDFGLDLAVLSKSGLRMPGAEVITTCHGPGYWHFRGNKMPWTDGEAENTHSTVHQTRLSDQVIFPSHYMKSLVENDIPLGRPRHHKQMIRNILPGPCRSFRGRNGFPVRKVGELVFFGRIERRKGIDQFCELVNRLVAASGDAVAATFLGKFGDEESYQSLERRLNVGVSLSVHTNFDSIEAINFLKTSDCLVVLPSTQDNLPYTVYECLENGIPMVCTDVGGIPELVQADDHERILVAADQARLFDTVLAALKEGFLPGRLAFDPDAAVYEQLTAFTGRAACPVPGEPPNVHVLVLEAGGVVAPGLSDQIDRWNAEHMVADTGWLAGATGQQGLSVLRDQVERSSADRMLLVKSSVVPDALFLNAAHRLIDAEGYDAVVSDYRLSLSFARGVPAVSAQFHAPAGPAELSPSRNVYGCGVFCIRRESLLRALDDVTEFDVRTFHWEVLNALCAADGSVVGIPMVLAVDHVASAKETENDGVFLCERLSAPWVKGLPRSAEYLVRKSIQRDYVAFDPNLKRFVEAAFGAGQEARFRPMSEAFRRFRSRKGVSARPEAIVVEN